jgi:hypothetical protein
VKLVTRLVLWLALAGAALIGLVEGAMWLAAPAPKTIGYRVELNNEIPGLKPKVAFAINEKYLRSWESAAGSGPTVHLVCLGGSATVGMLQDDADTWWGQLGALLQKEFPNARIKVSALTREAVGILYGAKWAKGRLDQVDCDVLVAMYGLDDILLHPETYAYNPGKFETIKLGGRERGALKQFLLDYSQVCRRISNGRARRGLAANLGRLREPNYYAKALARERTIYPQLPIKYELARTEGHDPLAEFVEGIDSLASTARACGASFVMIAEPTLHSGLMGPAEEQLIHRWYIAEPDAGPRGVYRIDSGRIEIELDRYFAAAAKRCQELGVSFITTRRKLPADSVHFVDDVLLSDQGAASLAGLLLPSFKPLVQARLQ